MNYKLLGGKRVHSGLIAQELKDELKDELADHAMHVYDPDADRHAVRYIELIPFLVKSVQELTQRNEDLMDKIVVLSGAIKELSTVKNPVPPSRQNNSPRPKSVESQYRPAKSDVIDYINKNRA